MTTVLDSIRDARDAMSVRRVFGEPYELNGVTVIPVARVVGGGGGGSGEGTRNEEVGSGFGAGFGLRAEPVGVYEVRNGRITWKPVIDIGRLAKSLQVLTGIGSVCATLVALRRGRPSAS